MLKKIFNFLLPSCCILCDNNTNQTYALCQQCEKNLPWITTSQHCQQCALPLPDPNTNICAQCIKKSPAFDRTITLWRYEPPITNMLMQLKLQRRMLYAHINSQLLLKKINNTYEHITNKPQAIIAVPLHTQRLRQRGFNQAIEIAKPIAKTLQLPLLRHTIKRHKVTTQQGMLSKARRRQNLKQAFQIQKAIPYSHIAIIDDVITTGATICNLSQTLKNAGIARIDVWSCARTLLSKK